MEFKKLINGRSLYVTPDKIWVAQGMTFFAIDYDGKQVSRKYTVGSLKDRLLSWNRLIRQLLRVGLHHLLPLGNGSILVTAKRKTYIVSPKGDIINVFSGYQGNKPGHQGVCVTPDGTVFFAEYLLNTNRDHKVNLYRSTDNGMNFQIVKTWAEGDIRHLHFVKWDEYENCLWLGSGDYGENGHENRLYKSTDNGDTWELVGQYGQDWRAIGVCFTKDALLWGTDAGSCPDTVHFVRMDRNTWNLEIEADLEGPCHGCASYKDGRAFFSTGVEGGENERDNYARLKEYSEGKIVDLWKLKKDIWPLVLQYGVMRFPLGTEQCTKVVFTTMGLEGHGEYVMIED
jgi:BNR/Asp-box repeat.